MFRITTILVLALVTNLSIAQTAQVDKKMLAKSKDAKSTQKVNPNLAMEHSQTAVAQIKAHLIETVEYPEEMLENTLEGQVVVKVLISKTGKIKKTSIAKSFNEGFNEAALKAMKSIKSLELSSKFYSGASVVYVPIKFSLE